MDNLHGCGTETAVVLMGWCHRLSLRPGTQLLRLLHPPEAEEEEGAEAEEAKAQLQRIRMAGQECGMVGMFVSAEEAQVDGVNAKVQFMLPCVFLILHDGCLLFAKRPHLHKISVFFQEVSIVSRTAARGIRAGVRPR